MTQPSPSALHTSNISSLPLLARGKVRDNYAVGDDRILMVASDRLQGCVAHANGAVLVR